MALPLQGEVVDEWWIDLLLGDCLGVDHVDDEVSHERLLGRECDMGSTFSGW